MIFSRRSFAAGFAAAALWPAAAFAKLDPRRKRFVDQAFAMKQAAIKSGDQPYAAVVVLGDTIVGWGPSRVVAKKNDAAHAEREAMRDAQARLGRSDLSDCAMYSTSPPCAECRRVAATNRLGRMYAGIDATDLGNPRKPVS
jgi:tRNA(Arg) A34 adenosine deaminase TadA